ncbi:alpha/beta fold hydrolase [Variovorax sp. Sphag1AA]|uniref:alpha/beta fold hydrolase n=1 Tax=Variovorax sp. Sphag1AA TaxID=2587027 RepID=UPI00161AE1D5|nr:alpha/beta hydrolase [Variovorax sp. Sphag1AA]MBB3181715.1 pimeloyl-ACP methyl ester carboxylesterase [Variovorax sp. Sphag1AA]
MAYRQEVLTSCSRKLALICGLLLLAGCQAWSARAPGAPQIKQASVNGVTLVYEEQGDGAPVVFIHGCCTDYRAWDAQRQAVAPHYRFIGLNMRYFGTAPWPADQSKYSQQTDVDDIASFIRGLNAGPVDLVGWSYSGPIVMLVVLQHPELVHSLIIHEPGSVSYISDPAIVKIASDDRAAALGPAIAAVKAGDFPSAARLTPIGVNHQPDFWDTTTPEIRAMFLDNARTWTLALAAPPQPPITCDALHQIKMPVLITVGKDTRSYFHIAAEGAAGCIPDVQFVTIPGRHLAIVQQPEAFNATLLQFLSKAGSRPKP